MNFDFINPFMLFGLAGIALPVLAHLLSRRKYDIVDWGAMPFLELGQNTRRKIRLEELLLLLLRMAIITVIVMVLSRPWAQGGFFSQVISTQTRDIVFVIDGSCSMGWESASQTPHEAARQWVDEFLNDLRPGDSISVLDAREKVRKVIDSPIRSFDLVREKIAEIPPPAGSSDLAAASAEAVRMLSRTSNLSREVIVLTDGQSLGWKADDDILWAQLDDLRNQPAVKPRLWVVNVSSGKSSGNSSASSSRINLSLETLQLSRELTVPDFPVRISTKIRLSGGQSTITRKVHFEVDGQRIKSKARSVQLEPDGEASVEFEYRFASTGSHVVSVVLDHDSLPGDNQADAAIEVVDALPVLLVDGTPDPIPVRSEVFFAKAALSADENDTPWIEATTMPYNDWDSAILQHVDVVFLANVRRLTDTQVADLESFVSQGGGLFIALGDQTDAVAFREDFEREGRGLSPAALQQVMSDDGADDDGIHISNGSLSTPWLRRFRAEEDGGMTTARFSQWWQVTPTQVATTESALMAMEDSDGNIPKGKSEKKRPGYPASAGLVLARLSNNAPLLLSRSFGDGEVLLFASTIDAAWNTLPARPDFVSFLHEVVFYLSSRRALQNVPSGAALLGEIASTEEFMQFQFVGPGDLRFAPELVGEKTRPRARLADTSVPGIYRFERRDSTAVEPPQYFVVNFDRSESDLTSLTEEEQTQLSHQDRMDFVADVEELKTKMFDTSTRTEIWFLLAMFFLGFLVLEVYMTRRIVKGGGVATTPETVPTG